MAGIGITSIEQWFQ